MNRNLAKDLQNKKARDVSYGQKTFAKENILNFKEKIAKDRKVIPDPIDDRKFQE